MLSVVITLRDRCGTPLMRMPSFLGGLPQTEVLPDMQFQRGCPAPQTEALVDQSTLRQRRSSNLSGNPLLLLASVTVGSREGRPSSAALTRGDVRASAERAASAEWAVAEPPEGCQYWGARSNWATTRRQLATVDEGGPTTFRMSLLDWD